MTNTGARNRAFSMMEKKVLPFDDIKKKMAHYCSYQDRCHSEVEQKLREFMLIPEAREELLLFLMKENYLNEERFTRSYIRGKFRIKQWGRSKIRQHLKQKGIGDRLINTCMDEIDERDYLATAEKLYAGAYQKTKGLQAYQRRIKATRYCLSRGFEYEIVQQCQTEE